MINYFIKVILCSAVFLLTYKVLLEREKMHRFNRFYLLASLISSFFIPIISFQYYRSILPVSESVILDTTILQYTGITPTAATQNSGDYWHLIMLSGYIIITALLLFRFILNLSKILSRAAKSPRIPYNDSQIVLVGEPMTPHSFLNYLFIYHLDYENMEREVLIHEYAHIQQRHSYDILFMEMVHVFIWFNPFLLLYKRAIQLNHEYLADDFVIKASHNIAHYQCLLIAKSNHAPAEHLTSQFNYSITKKRLIMITKSNSISNKIGRLLFILPVWAASIFLFSAKGWAQEPAGVQKGRQITIPSTQEGVSQALLEEYGQIVKGVKDEKGFPDLKKLSEADKNRLEKIYLSMSVEQQASQMVVFMPAPSPLPKIVPTPSQLEAWTNEKEYGLWINEKHVPNSVLANYKHSDFAQVFISKLAKNTVNYSKYHYQVDLMTREFYAAYCKEASLNKHKFNIGIRMPKRS